MTSDSTYKNVKRVVIWSLCQGLGEFYAQDGGLTGQLGWGLLLGQGDDCCSFILGQDQGQHVSLRAWAARKRWGWFLSQRWDAVPQLLASGPARASEACSWLHTPAQTLDGTPWSCRAEEPVGGKTAAHGPWEAFPSPGALGGLDQPCQLSPDPVLGPNTQEGS